FSRFLCPHSSQTNISVLMDGLITVIRCFSLSAKAYSYGASPLIARYCRKSKSPIRKKRRLPQCETCFSTEFAPLLLRTGSDSLKAPITQVAPLAASRLTAAIAVTVLTGWLAQIDLLKNFAPGMIAMNPFTAGGLLAASVALFLGQPVDASKKRSVIGQLLAGATTFSTGDSSSYLDRCPPPNRGESRALRSNLWRGSFGHNFHGSIFHGHLVDGTNGLSHR